MNVPLLQVGSGLACAVNELMAGRRTVLMEYHDGDDRIDNIALLIGHLLVNRPAARIVMPVFSQDSAVHVRWQIEERLRDFGLDPEGHMSSALIELGIDYGSGNHFAMSSAWIKLPFSVRDNAMPKAGHLLILDSLLGRVALAHSRSVRAPQVLLVGSRKNRVPHLGRRPGIVRTPWGPPPLEVALAGARR